MKFDWSKVIGAIKHQRPRPPKPFHGGWDDIALKGSRPPKKPSGVALIEVLVALAVVVVVVCIWFMPDSDSVRTIKMPDGRHVECVYGYQSISCDWGNAK